MENHMNKDLISRITVILLWLVSVILWIMRGWWYITAALFVLHFVEMFVIGVRTGRENRRSVFFSIVMTLVFGVTWWGPLRKDK